MDEPEPREADEGRSGRTPDAALPPGARQFPCLNCGGPLTYLPGSTELKCPYCGTANEIPLDAADGSHLAENDFLAALEAEEKRQESGETGPARDAARCGHCGAETTVDERTTSAACPYCGHPLTMQNLFKLRLNVQAVLPFAIDADKAAAIYAGWVRSRWFAPGDFKRRATRAEAMRGCYMPYWTYDSDTATRYAGQRGDVYYETVMTPVSENGRTRMVPRQVARVRWTPVSGDVRVAFDDILVPAAKSVPMDIQDGLKPWDLAGLQPFRQEFLAGFVTESYQVPLRDGFEEAKRRMEPEIAGAIERDIGGDQQRIDGQRTDYSGTTFKHILLPVWLSAYAYGGETYRFTVNAQNGRVSGNRPYSVWKIALAVLAGLVLIGLLMAGLGGCAAPGREEVSVHIRETGTQRIDGNPDSPDDLAKLRLERRKTGFYSIKLPIGERSRTARRRVWLKVEEWMNFPLDRQPERV